MMLEPTYRVALAVGLAVASVVALAAWFVPSPYGRFSSRRLGPVLPPKLGWILMELPAPIAFFVTFSMGSGGATPLAVVVAVIWGVHYSNRGMYNPLRMRVRPGGEMSVTVVVLERVQTGKGF